jgi:serine/threonine protein kinase
MLLNNRYRVIQTLGSGGFGETFLAEDTQMPSKRRCVVKQLKPVQNNPQIKKLVQERFQREAAILEELGGASTQIPNLYAYFENDEQFYLVQEWIEGETLTRRLLRQGLWNENQVRDMLVNLLPVLSFVHSKHIVHRDIKPDNIILWNSPSARGIPVLIDFGAVRESMGTVLNSQGTPTSSIIIGTPGYMPPEQAAGRPTYASDLYSLGVTAIYLLTGKQPHELEIDVQTGEIVWHPFAVHVSSVLMEVIDKAIRYHPRERYPSAEAMLLDLHSTAQTVSPTIQEQVPLTQAVAPKATVKSSSRNGIVIGSFVGAGLVGALVTVIATKSPFVSKIADKNTPITPSHSIEAIDTPQQKNQQSPKNNENLPSSFYVLADSAYSKLETANQQVEKLKVAGYQQAGVFWIPDYPNLSGKKLFQIYAGRFNTRAKCVDLLRSYGLQNKDAYCTKASKDASESPDQFYFKSINKSSDTTVDTTNNYSWLQQRPVTDADLDGKSAFELDIMRNSIFAQRGRRFNIPELQSYFDKQSWYRPQYSPEEFDKSNLLSDLEISNAMYIKQYQTRFNRQFFK